MAVCSTATPIHTMGQRTMRDDVVETLRRRYGDDWGKDDEDNLRFSVDAEHLLRHVDGAHLIGDPEVEDGSVELTVWVDYPLPDLMSADQLAYEIFARLSEDIFFAERHFGKDTVRYPFVTGSPRGGHIGALVLAGPHAADFAERYQRRLTGGLGYQA